MEQKSSLTKDHFLCDLDDEHYMALLQDDMKDEVIKNFTDIFWEEDPFTVAEKEECGATYELNYVFFKCQVEEGME